MCVDDLIDTELYIMYCSLINWLTIPIFGFARLRRFSCFWTRTCLDFANGLSPYVPWRLDEFRVGLKGTSIVSILFVLFWIGNKEICIKAKFVDYCQASSAAFRRSGGWMIIPSPLRRLNFAPFVSVGCYVVQILGQWWK